MLKNQGQWQSAMIRPAREDEAELLTGLAVESKSFWKYPPEHMEVFKRELRFSAQYIIENKVYVYEDQGQVLAWYSLRYLKDDIDYKIVMLKKGWWLDHMFVKPEHIGRGLGMRMFVHFAECSAEFDAREVQILADPHAKGFYQRMGCRYLEEYPSSIPGRTTPYLVWKS